jgi:hypothetical protein
MPETKLQRISDQVTLEPRGRERPKRANADHFVLSDRASQQVFDGHFLVERQVFGFMNHAANPMLTILQSLGCLAVIVTTNCAITLPQSLLPGLPPASLPVVSFHDRGGVLGGDKGIAFVLQTYTLFRCSAFSLTSSSLAAVSSMLQPQSMAVILQEKSAMLRSGPLPARLGGAPARERA